jgi:structural maintenance of chromosome 3 (chondroitin sulfate proteoglycan 6)
MEDTENKREKIQETMELIDSRLADLDEEKEQLKRYNALDRTRRSLECTVHEKDLGETVAKLDEVEASRRKHAEEAWAKEARTRALHSETVAAERECEDPSGAVGDCGQSGVR